jgi:hypothetical protein
MADEKTELQHLKSIDESLRTIKGIMFWWLIISIVGALAVVVNFISTH